MAALVVQNGASTNRLQAAVPTAAAFIQRMRYSSGAAEDVKPLNSTRLSAMKRGTGGRSSFSGIVATVFGASGFLGNHVVHRLGKIGSQVIVPYRGDHYELLRLRLAGDLGQVLFVPFHLRDDESIYTAVKYSNVVINLIGRNYETKNFTFDDINVEGAARLARISKEAGVEKFVHISDLNAAEKPTGHVLQGGSKNLISKYKGELAVRKEFPEAIIFRPSFITGNNDSFLYMYTHFMRHSFFKVPLYKKGEETIKQPVYVFDMAQGIIEAIKSKDSAGKTYQAVGPKRYRLSDLVDWFHLLMEVDQDYYKRSNIKTDLFFRLQLLINQLTSPGSPYGGVTWDLIERESVTDVVVPNLPTLEDLGVPLTPMEEYTPWVYRPFRELNYYDHDIKEFNKPVPPHPVT